MTSCQCNQNKNGYFQYFSLESEPAFVSMERQQVTQLQQHDTSGETVTETQRPNVEKNVLPYCFNIS